MVLIFNTMIYASRAVVKSHDASQLSRGVGWAVGHVRTYWTHNRGSARADLLEMRIDEAGARGVNVSDGAAPRGTQEFSAALCRPTLGTTQARQCLAEAWTAELGQAPSAKTQALLTAHWAHETDHGRSMPGFNFGGIKASARAPGAVYRTLEGYGPSEHEVRARFRSYRTPAEGARDYVRLLHTHYPVAIAAAQAGNAGAFVQALARGGYFTAEPGAYEAALKRRLAETEGVIAEPSGARPVGTVPSVAETALQGVLLQLLRTPEDSA